MLFRSNLGNLLRNSGYHDRALAHFRKAASAQPRIAPARQELMYALLDVCAWDEAEAIAAQLRSECAAQTAGWMHAIAPLTAYCLGLDAAACKRLAVFHAMEAARNVAPVPRSRVAAGARLRIGYLSPDFREHPVGQLMAAGLSLHDRSRFEVFAYSSGSDDHSDCRKTIADSVEHFVDIERMTDADAANRIAQDGVQLLIDLGGHTTGSRLGILARRPEIGRAHV